MASYRSLKPGHAIILLSPVFIVTLAFLGFPSEFYHSLRFTDPDYGYLLNSLMLLQGNAPSHVDHPGTTVQIFGAVMLLLRHGLGVIDGTLLDPYGSIRFVVMAQALVVALTSFFYGRYLLKSGFPPWIPLVCQFSIFLLGDSWTYLLHLSPEAYFLMLAYLVAFALSAAEARETPARGILLGTLLGAGIVTKVNFAPVLISAALLRRLPVFLACLAAAVLSFCVITIPIWPKYSNLVTWLTGLLLHQEKYGQGQMGIIPEWPLLWANMGLLLAQAGTFLAGTLLLLAGIAFNDGLRSRRFWTTVAMFSTLFVLVWKHPGARYLLPATVLWTCCLPRLLLSLEARAIGPLKKAVALLSVIFLAVCLYPASTPWRAHLQDMRVIATIEPDIVRLRRENSQCARLIIGPSPSIESALRFGNGSAGGAFTERLNRLYPLAYFHTVVPSEFTVAWRQADIETLKSRLDAAPCLVLDGYAAFSRERFEVETLFERYQIGIWKLKKFR